MPSTYAFKFDPTTPAEQTLDGFNNVTATVDKTGLNHTGTTVSGAGPTYETGTNRINDQNVFGFVGANLDGITVSGTQSSWRNAEATWIWFAYRFDAVAATQRIFTLFGSTGVPAISISVLTSLKVRVGTRRVPADASETVDSDVLITLGQQGFGLVMVNWNTGDILIKLDGEEEHHQVKHGTPPVSGWESGLDNSEDSEVSVLPIIGRTTSNNMTAFIGQIAGGTGVLSAQEIEDVHLTLSSQYDTPLKKLIITEESTYKLNRGYRGPNHTQSFTVTKRYPSVGGALTVRARLKDSATGATTLAAANVGDTNAITYSLTFNRVAPLGSHYLEVRQPGQGDASAVTSINRIGVGKRGLIFGYSDVGKWVYEMATPYPTTTPAPEEVKKYRRHSHPNGGWWDPVKRRTNTQFETGTGELTVGATKFGCGGNGLTRFQMSLATLLGEPVFVEFHAQLTQDGSVAEHLPPGTAWNNGTAGAGYPYMKQSIEADDGPGWDFDFVLISLGLRETFNGMDQVEFLQQVEALRTHINDMCGETVPLFLAPIGSFINSNYTDDAASSIRNAAWRYARTVGQLGGSIPDVNVTGVYTPWNQCDEDIALGDGVQHWSPLQYERFARRAAQSIARVLKPQSVSHSGAGPYISGCTATAGTNTASWSWTLNGGTQLVDKDGLSNGSGFDDIQIQVNGVARTLTSATLSSNTLVAVFGGAPLAAGNIIGIRKGHGKNPSRTNIIRDNTMPGGDTIGAPAQPTDGYFTFQLPSP